MRTCGKLRMRDTHTQPAKAESSSNTEKEKQTYKKSIAKKGKYKK